MAHEPHPAFQIAPLTPPLLPPGAVLVAGPDPGAAEADSLDIGAFLARLARQWWVIALTTFLALGAAVAYLKITPKKYESTATLRVEQERKPLLPTGQTGGGGEDIRALEMLKTIEQGLTSQNNLRRVVEVNNLAAAPSFAAGPSSADLIWALSKRTKAELRRGTRLIDVRVEDTDPERARLLAASIVDEYIAATNEEAKKEASAQAQQLRENAVRLEKQIAETNAKLQQYRETHRGLPLEKGDSLADDKVKDLSARLAQAAAERTRLEAARKEIATLGPRADVDAILKVQGAAASEDITALKSAIAQKEAEFARLRERYLPKHPKYLQAHTELASLRKQLEGVGRQSTVSLAASIAHLANTEKALRAQLEKAQAEALEASRVAGPYQVLTAQLQSGQESFNAVQAQLKIAEVAALAAPDALSLADAPVAATAPSKPNKKLVAGLAGFLGMSAGTGLALLGMMVRRRFDSAEAAEKALKLPSLAIVPRAEGAERKGGMLDNLRAENACTEAFRTLRTALSMMGRGSAARSTLFISAQGGEGTSYVAAGYAVSLAKQGYRTLLIDGNLRHPQLDDAFFGGRNPSGLATYLEGRAPAGQACRPTHVPELFLLSAGQASINPSELLSGKKLRLLLDDAQRWFHRVVIDASALTESNDGMVMAREVDHTVFVVNSRRSRPSLAVQCARRLSLSGVRPVGFVLNEAPAGAAVWQPAAAPARATGLSFSA